MSNSIQYQLRSARDKLTELLDSQAKGSTDAFGFTGEIRMLVDHALNDRDEETMVERIKVAANMIERKFSATDCDTAEVINLKKPRDESSNTELAGAFRCVKNYKTAIARETTIAGKTLCRIALIICFANQVVPGAN
jgi:hypothetical protein